MEKAVRTFNQVRYTIDVGLQGQQVISKESCPVTITVYII